MSAISVFGSEVTKARSVRSTYWTVIVAVVGGIALGTLLTATIVATWDQMPRMQRATLDPVSISLSGLDVAVISLIVFGALVITSEYSTKQITVTLAAVPSRPRLLAGKALVVALVALVAGVIVSFVSFFVGQAFFASLDMQSSLADSTALWAVLRAAVLLPLIALIALAVGTLVRSSAGAITIVIGGIYLPGVVAMLLPAWARDNIYPFFPGAAVTNLMHPDDGLWARSATGAMVILVVWTVVLLAGAAAALVRRDA
ncbi:hypothetical protein [Spongiactinospora sp. TRM90649]|uniref:hypothetical protein n=1 Tax=Spongiactinospora sp. TRM90649 TaxID=3031114 RepID=UPI0023F730ED|nr:hypothetical protein [Spongiactinospora sp. TRM90649]MDF5756527.1 hypothetical protein [Spongiactinospora sp. TRM90649]